MQTLINQNHHHHEAAKKIEPNEYENMNKVVKNVATRKSQIETVEALTAPGNPYSINQ